VDLDHRFWDLVILDGREKKKKNREARLWSFPGLLHNHSLNSGKGKVRGKKKGAWRQALFFRPLEVQFAAYTTDMPQPERERETAPEPALALHRPSFQNCDLFVKRKGGEKRLN